MPGGSGRGEQLSLAVQAPACRDGAWEAQPCPQAPPGATGGVLAELQSPS